MRVSREKTLICIFYNVFLPFAGVYFLTAFFNQINAMLAPYLLQDLKMNPTQLGWTTSIYLLIFAIAQLPLGFFLDRYGPKRVQLVLFIVAAVGIMVFSTAKNPLFLFLGRGLIGMGMSGGLMSGFKALSMYLSKNKIPLANGSLMAVGSLGAVCSTIPVEMTLQVVNWRIFLMYLLIFILIISTWLLYVVPEKNSTFHRSVSLKQQILEIKEIYFSNYFWRIAPMVSFAFGSNMAIVGLWAGPWLSDVAHLDSSSIAKHLFTISISLIIGIFLWGIIADKMTRVHHRSITQVIGVGALLYLFVQILLVVGVGTGSYWLWIVFGFMSRFTTLAYAAIAQHFHEHYVGRAITALNMLFFITAFFVQLSIGVIIDFWSKGPAGNSFTEAYRVAFGLVVVLQMFGYLWFYFYKKA